MGVKTITPNVTHGKPRGLPYPSSSDMNDAAVRTEDQDLAPSERAAARAALADIKKTLAAATPPRRASGAAAQTRGRWRGRCR